ncbi:MAG: cyclic pyranopterin monophosphate synthase MoaC [Nannocystaceae bacterium]
MSDSLTHFDSSGSARMVTVSDKPERPRTAVAQASIHMQRATFERIDAGKIGKGDVLGVARLAAIGAAKRTADLIPLCHPVRLTGIDIAFQPLPDKAGFVVRVCVSAYDRTGPEMEALAAAGVGALTIYDMCKAMDRAMVVKEVLLVSKSGGQSGTWIRATESQATTL